MLNYYNTALALQEVPHELSLAVNVTGCPFGCEGCHSPHLHQPGGHPASLLGDEIRKYQNLITCVLFMGGDWAIEDLASWIQDIRAAYPSLKIALYGATELKDYPQEFLKLLDYLKTGPYIQERGGLDNPNTNQRFYRVVNGLPHPEAWQVVRPE